MDFEDEIANFGDTVNTRQPGEFQAKRKGVNDNVTVQAATSTNIPVKLNQHVHTSFLIRDGEESKAFKNLVAEYLAPAMIAQARFIDQIVLGQFPQFLVNGYGKLGGLSKTTAQDYILGTRGVMNTNKVPPENRNMIWTVSGETAALGTELFISAEKRGDDGTALRTASLGMVLGFDHYMCQNASEYLDGDVAATGAINAGNLAVGSTTITVDGFSAAISNNSWIKIAGDPTPHRVVSTVGGSTPTSITIASPGLRNVIADNDVVTVYDAAAVNLAAGYDSGYDGYIAVDGFTLPPRVGQFLTFGTTPTSAIYTIIDYDSTDGIQLDRPLEAAIADNDLVNLTPGGQYNFAFTKNAIALVTRPLAAPMTGAGALSSVINYNGLSMRAVITYDGNKQGHLVTLDMLCGVKVLDTDLGVPLFG